MKLDRGIVNLTFTVVVVIVILILTQQYLGDSLGEIITIITAVFGVFSILYQLRKDYQISKAEFIYSLNDSFSNNAEIAYVYMLLKNFRDNVNQTISEDDGRRMGDYIMFFEIMGYLLEENMITLELMDKIFANKFFLFMNNPYVQKYQLAYSEINKPILELYCVWYNYRLKIGRRELYPQNSFSKFKSYVLVKPNGQIYLNENEMSVGYD
ncbi:hypothetical protein QE109_08265 [Fusibacter bizertensis]|jgi:hypothetical protein|uniref:DUF4760 domain-containing protein n=1 Tax=Fusibacter bizertensis TaxID=1488331 RepID=A0ABT6NCI8_9FIRM|nr:hypothetical protein [Fusibacter bizertensis]MDH8678139.1 hypothetical protein [Fusibacter bizertensis]